MTTLTFIWVCLALLLAIAGYPTMNKGIVESSSGINLGLMNILAGIFNAVLFFKEIKQQPLKPNWPIVTIQTFGIVMILFGLRLVHRLLADPVSAMTLVYEPTGALAMPLWLFAAMLLHQKLPRLYSWEIAAHLWMIILVSFRLWLHWQPNWDMFNIIPALLLTLIGYFTFNLGVELASVIKTGRITQVTSNICSGIVVCIIFLVIGGPEAATWNWGTLIGATGITMIVVGLAYAYKKLNPLGLKHMVTSVLYGGVVITVCFPLVMEGFGQRSNLWDWIITLAMLGILIYRIIRYIRETKRLPVSQALKV